MFWVTRMADDNEKQIESEDNNKSYCQTTTYLSKYLLQSLERVLKEVTDDKFVCLYKACYKEFEKKDGIHRPSLSGSSVEAKKYRIQFNDIVIKNISETVDETVGNMNNKLKKLEDLKDEQTENCTFWRPPGDAFKHMIPFEYVSQMEKKKEIEDKIYKEYETLNVLKGRILRKRKKAEELHEVLLSLTDDIKRIVTHKVRKNNEISNNNILSQDVVN